MRQLSAAGQQAVNDIAQRHGFSPNAVGSMLESVLNGNGSMAQFNHPEFSGSGQWMSGGMTMVSDMFNNYLKGRVDGLCSELARLVAGQPSLLQPGSFQSQSQGGQNQGGQSQGGQSQGGQWQGSQDGFGGNGAAQAGVSLFVPPAPGAGAEWWGDSLRWPNSTGAQNGVRYAHFAQARRLAIEVNGTVTIYDTLDHQIGGFSQQQSYGGSVSFNSQYGLVDVSRLPVVSVNGVAPAGGAEMQPPQLPQSAQATQPPQPTQPTQPTQLINAPQADSALEGDVFGKIEKLAELRGKGILSEDEFTAKKMELLSRL